MKYWKIGFLASCGGSNMQAVIDSCKKGEINGEPVVLISNNSKCFAMERAKNENIPSFHISSKKYPQLYIEDEEITNILKKYNVDIVVLAGYTKKLGSKTISEFKRRIINIHPALLPKYGGEGMYGNNVHKAVLEAKDKFTGATIHIVNEEYDKGSIIEQCQVEVYENDTIESLSIRVHQCERKFLSNTLKKICNGDIDLDKFNI